MNLPSAASAHPDSVGHVVTDGLPGLAFAAETAEPNVMRRPPRRPGESVFAGGMDLRILWVGLLMGGVCLGLEAWAILTPAYALADHGVHCAFA
jgi:magnesium-transporting ATPase (P-type)